jgi:hypothetical protein
MTKSIIAVLQPSANSVSICPEVATSGQILTELAEGCKTAIIDFVIVNDLTNSNQPQEQLNRNSIRHFSIKSDKNAE